MVTKNLDKTFNVKFSSNGNFFAPKFAKTSSIFSEFKEQITPTEPEEVDEIIYYDGGGVEGYGD